MITHKQRGRPNADIDKTQFEKLCELQCTLEEMACFFCVTNKTIEDWCKRTYNMNFYETFKQKRQGGYISLRRAQFRLAQKNAAMAIFLGKNYLGQVDKDIWQRKQDEKALELKEKALEQADW